MKKIFILAYAKGNLGDDLFIYLILKKYPNTQFYINIPNKQHAKLFEKFENITIYEEQERKLTKENANEYDGYIYVGGSIFMEGGVVYNISLEFLEFMKQCKKQNIPFHYVSSNFGPFETKEYVELAKEIFNNCTSVCFRDKYSSNMFKNINSVKYVPDLAFCYQPEKVNKIPNSVGITVIDLNIRKNLKKYTQNYYITLEKNIKEYIKQNKEVTLFSFCKYEGDEHAIEELLSGLQEDVKKKIKVAKYNGNIEEFLREYSKMEYMICSRFHAMILSIIMKQKCQIISYSDKIDNVVKDLELFKDNIIHFEQLNNTIEMPVDKFEKTDDGKISQIIKKAQKQLEELDKTCKN